MPSKRSKKILFNASVILSGLRSPQGGSGILLSYVTKRTMRGIISETILEEVVRNAHKAGLSQEKASLLCHKLFSFILPPPTNEMVHKYEKFVHDKDDAHLFATYQEARCDSLVSLDKHHVLALRGKLHGVTIHAPGELITLLRKHS